MGIADAISKFLADRARRCNPASVQWYRSQLRLLAAWLTSRGVRELAGVTPALLADYIEHLKRRPKLNTHSGTISAVTVQKRAKGLRSFFLFCERQSLIGAPLARTIPVPSAGRRLPKALPLEQVRRLLTAEMSARDRAAIALMLDAGPRLSEVCGLDMDDVDLRERTALIRHGKGDKARIIVFGDEVVAELRIYLAERARTREPALFLNQYGRRLSGDALYRAVKTAAAQVGLDAVVRPHVLRHTFATHALDNDAPLTDVQAQLGHEHISTTMIYASVSRAGMRRRHGLYSPLKRIKGC
jgi:integrase/recombinase XerD